MLQYARQNGCAWDSSTCVAAASGGHLAVLQYARQNGCAWGPEVCSGAALFGHLSILKWLRQSGCQWDCCTSTKAAFNNHFDVFAWARQQRPPCPLWDWTLQYFRHSFCRINPCMLVYLAQQQLPLHVSHLARARVSATEMTWAFLSLKAALPDRTPHKVVLSVVSLASSGCGILA